ncbi:hypothetical protein FF098_009730 [Parvularcula flava]|uniref:Uncharacterized protein n=1 Tax=Aquisalinus luteolus TaxID=1566827 RepID=A0A8J3EUM6_9PROT|nr:hypothetical protein [Aquisalinus luteolus]NHK28182.1 hypothetical protein [Aquisalinus luteolus]GGH97711.1 hypothetical protein GCM10011355_19590 [Aquisalinus luteolus]
MILRRFMIHVSEQNWTAVVLDFAIVVFGVYIGLQLGNWNDAREERERETAILQRLHVDFEQLELLDTYAAASAEQGFRSADLLIGAVEDGTLTQYEDEQLYPAVQAALTVRPPNGPSSTYTEIVASGQVSLLQNSELREWLATYDKGQDAYATVHSNLYDMALREAFPIWRMAEFDDTINDEGRVVLGPVSGFDFDRLATDPELVYAMRAARRIMGTHHSYTEHLANMSNQISLILEEELGEGPSEQIVTIREQRQSYREQAEEMSRQRAEKEANAATSAASPAEAEADQVSENPTAAPVPDDIVEEVTEGE